MTSSSANELKFKFRHDVKIARHGSDAVVLVGEFSPQSLRLTGASSRLTDLLAAGCTRKDLCDRLQNLGYDTKEAEPAINTFLNRLSAAHFLQSETNASSELGAQGTSRMINIDPLAKLFARPFSWFPAWLIKGMGCVVFAISLAVIIRALFKGLLLPPAKDFMSWALIGLLGCIPQIFLHELAHAVACRAVGCPVTGLRIRHTNILRFSIFVDTRYLPLIQNRWAKAWVSLAGPFTDFIVLAFLSFLILQLSPDSKILAPIRLLCFFITLVLWFNLNPWAVTDGSNAASVLADDPYLRVNSLYSGRERKLTRGHLWYRLAAVVYALTLFTFIGYRIRAWYS